MKKKGFTLIELLAVIVILAIIALISTPVILNVIERANKGAFEDSAYGVIEAAKLYYTEAALDGKNNKETFTFPADTKLKLSGKKPSGGSVVLDEDGKIGLAIYNEKWCAVKGKDEEKITIKDYKDGECIVGEVENPNVPETCFTVSDDTITGYTCTNKNIVIPSIINGVTIKKIGDNAFKDKGLTQISIPEGITSIGSSAFEGNQLTSVTIPDSVTTIADNAFNNNKNNIEIFINTPSSCFTVDESNPSKIAGYTCENKIISIPREINGVTITEIGVDAFKSKNLVGVTIPNSIKKIWYTAFNENQLTNLVIKDGIESIEAGAFAENQLTVVEIPSSITSISQTAFSANQTEMKVIINKPKNSIENSPWGASSVEWVG